MDFHELSYPKNPVLVETDELQAQLYPQSSKKLTSSARFSGREDADNKIYSCRYTTEKIPIKEICKDTIKYRDVKKSREVTAYRPVTKSWTETKCN